MMVVPNSEPHPSPGAQSFYGRYGKRLFDLAIAIPALVVALPVIAVVGVAVLLRIGAPALFKQERPGLNAKPFMLYKFRTMTNAVGQDGQMLPDAERLTRFGTFLRVSSLDELPEIWNIIRGDMSFIGPRPLLMQYLPLYSPEQFRRHEVKPGLTGLAQISGRNLLTWDQKFAADVKYVDACSLSLDLSILVRTVQKIITRDGISAPGEATMPYFKGNGGTVAGKSQKGSNDR